MPGNSSRTAIPGPSVIPDEPFPTCSHFSGGQTRCGFWGWLVQVNEGALSPQPNQTFTYFVSTARYSFPPPASSATVRTKERSRIRFLFFKFCFFSCALFFSPLCCSLLLWDCISESVRVHLKPPRVGADDRKHRRIIFPLALPR